MHDPQAHHHEPRHPSADAPVEPGYPEHPEQARPGQATKDLHASQGHPGHGHDAHGGAHDKHAGHSVAMFRDKFWLSFLLTVPTLIWGHMLPRVLR